jgi:hypothetical protein
MSWHQVAAGVLAGFGMKLLYGVRYTDMCAFRAIRRDALLGLGMSQMTYGWNIEMQMRAARAGLRILEIPVPYRCRTGGASKVAGSLSGSVKAAGGGQGASGGSITPWTVMTAVMSTAGRLSQARHSCPPATVTRPWSLAL